MQMNITDIKLWLSIFGNITSIIGFIVTIAIWLGLKGLKAFYVAKATVPQQLIKLNDLRERFNEILNGKYDNESKISITATLAEISVHIDNLSPKLRIVDRSQYKTQIEPHLKSLKPI